MALDFVFILIFCGKHFYILLMILVMITAIKIAKYVIAVIIVGNSCLQYFAVDQQL